MIPALRLNLIHSTTTGIFPKADVALIIAEQQQFDEITGILGGIKGAWVTMGAPNWPSLIRAARTGSWQG